VQPALAALNWTESYQVKQQIDMVSDLPIVLSHGLW